jgi:hypothetical protein
MVKCKRELEGANASEVVHPATKSEAIEADVCELRERFVSLGPDAVLGVQKAIRGGNGRLAFEVLQRIGAVPICHDANSVMVQQPQTEPDEQAEVDKMIVALYKTVALRKSVFRTPDPEMDADLDKVGGRINYDTGQFERIADKP